VEKNLTTSTGSATSRKPTFVSGPKNENFAQTATPDFYLKLIIYWMNLPSFTTSQSY